MAEIRMVLPNLAFRRPPRPPAVPITPDDKKRRRPEPPVRRFVWTKYAKSGFPHRVNHATVSCTDRKGKRLMISVGGYHNQDKESPSIAPADDEDSSPSFRTGPIDMHCMDVDNRSWKPVHFIDETRDPNIVLRGGVPPQRYGHTCAYHNGRIFMYGGRNDDDGSFKIVECFDVERRMWLLLKPVGEKPSSRDGHAVTVIGNEMYMHGGFDSRALHFTNTLYVFDMDTHIWRLIPNEGDDVPARDFHTAVALDDRIVVFGGRSEDSTFPYYFVEVYDENFYEYSLKERKWSKVAITGYRPLGRRSVVAGRYGQHSIIYFGGYNQRHQVHFDDLFIYNSETHHVTLLKPFGTGPCPRRRVGQCSIGTEFIICGGTSPHTDVTTKKTFLKDNDEMYILSLLPSLQQLCMIAVKEARLDTSILPEHIKKRTSSKVEATSNELFAGVTFKYL